MTILEFLIKIYLGKKVIKKNLIIILLANFIAIGITILSYTSLQQSNTKTIIFHKVPIDIKRDIYQNLEIRKLVEKGLDIKVEKDELGFDVWDYIFTGPENIDVEKAAIQINKLIFLSLDLNKKFLTFNEVQRPQDNYLLYNILEYEKDYLNKKNYFIKPTHFKIQKIVSIFMQLNIFAIIFIFIIRIRKFKNLSIK